MGNLKKKVQYQSKGVKQPTQKEFDLMTQKQKEGLVKQYPNVYKVSDDTPTKDQLSKKMGMGGPMPMMYKKGGFPDLSGDGKITQKDILMGKGVIKKTKKKMGGPRKVKKKGMGGMKDMYKEGGVKKSTASEFLSPPSVYNLDD